MGRRRRLRRLDAVMKVRGGADQVNGSHLGEWKPPLGEAECIALLSICRSSQTRVR